MLVPNRIYHVPTNVSPFNVDDCISKRNIKNIVSSCNLIAAVQ